MDAPQPAEAFDKNQPPAPPPTYSSAELFQGSRVLIITHEGETYRLLMTRNNRLMLQK